MAVTTTELCARCEVSAPTSRLDGNHCCLAVCSVRPRKQEKIRAETEKTVKHRAHNTANPDGCTHIKLRLGLT
jgi:hypothetical protein